MKFEFLLLDLDDTILDFHKAEYIALGKTLESFGLDPTEQVRARYSRINKAYWERLERKELTREQVLVGRFQELFAQYGIAVDPESCARRYEDNLSVGHYFLPGAQEALERLSKKYNLFPRKSVPISRILRILPGALPRSPGLTRNGPSLWETASHQIFRAEKMRVLRLAGSIQDISLQLCSRTIKLSCFPSWKPCWNGCKHPLRKS